MAILNINPFDEKLHRAAVIYAATNGTTLKQLVCEGLAQRIGESVPVQLRRGAPKKEK